MLQYVRPDAFELATSCSVNEASTSQSPFIWIKTTMPSTRPGRVGPSILSTSWSRYRSSLFFLHQGQKHVFQAGLAPANHADPGTELFGLGQIVGVEEDRHSFACDQAC